MKGKTSAIIAAAFCAGLFVTVVPGIAPELAAGPAEDSSLVVPDIVTIDKFAAMWAPTAATVQRAAKGRPPIAAIETARSYVPKGGPIAIRLASAAVARPMARILYRSSPLTDRRSRARQPLQSRSIEPTKAIDCLKNRWPSPTLTSLHRPTLRPTYPSGYLLDATRPLAQPLTRATRISTRAAWHEKARTKSMMFNLGKELIMYRRSVISLAAAVIGLRAC